MMMPYAAPLVAGIANAIQPGQSTQLAKSLGQQPFVAGLISMLVGTATLLAVGLATGRLVLLSPQQMGQAPWWAWGGGVLGAGLLLAQLFVSHRIGAAAFLGILVTAGVITSIALDHFGLVGFDGHSAGPGRLIGGALMIAGVSLVAPF